MEINIQDVIRVTMGKAIGPIVDDLPIEKVSTDTRSIAKNDLFFALVGKKFDAHDFLLSALELGARHFVISNAKKIPSGYSGLANFIVVEDTLKAYGDLARFYREKFKIPVIGITGSSGKTTVKELTAHILSTKFNVLKNQGTENNLIGVPKTLFQLDRSHQVAVLEMGTNYPGEIERLSSIARPTVGVITLVGASHLEGLKDLEGVFKEKRSLLKYVDNDGSFVMNQDDERLRQIKTPIKNIYRVGLNDAQAQFSASNIQCLPDKTIFLYQKKYSIETSLLGRHNVLNVLMAMQCAIILGMNIEEIAAAILSFKTVAGRLAPKLVGDVYFIDDSYNSNPASLKAAILLLKEIQAKGRKGLVCGDMLELGLGSRQLHIELGELAAKSGLDYIIVAGVLAGELGQAAIGAGFSKEQVYFAKDSQEAGKILQKICQSLDTVLVKGSRSTRMEKVFECFMSCSTH